MNRRTWRRRLLVAVLIVAACVSFHYVRNALRQLKEPRVVWTKHFDAEGDEVGVVIIGRNGIIYAAGARVPPSGGRGGGTRPFLASYSPAGKMLWMRHYYAGTYEGFSSAAVDCQGDLYLTGRRSYDIEGHYSIPLMKMSADGKVLRSRRLGRGLGGNTFGTGVALDTGGNIYVVGSNGKDLANREIHKLGPNWQVLWSKELAAGGYGELHQVTIYGVAVNEQNEVYVVGGGEFDENCDFFGKLSPQGKSIWFYERQRSTFCSDSVGIYAVKTDGAAVYIAGSIGEDQKRMDNPSLVKRIIRRLTGSEAVSRSEGFIAKYDTRGHQVWIRRFGADECSGFDSLTLDSRGGVYASGAVIVKRLGYGMENIRARTVVAKCSPDGKVLWQKQLNGGSAGRRTGLVVGRHGDVYVSGSLGWTHDDTSTGGFLAKLQQ